MRKIVMTLLCLIAVISGRAQESEKGTWTLTPKVGLNWAKMTNGDIWYENDKKASTKGKVGIVIGAEAEYRLLSGLGISAHVNRKVHYYILDGALGAKYLISCILHQSDRIIQLILCRL